MEAGCKKKKWEINKGVSQKYHWIGTGELLATRVCIMDDYQKHFPPNDETTKVYITIRNDEVRAVNAKSKTLSIDFSLIMRWQDSRIKSHFTDQHKKGGKVLLGPKAVNNIWYPDLRVYNRQSFKPTEEWALLKKAQILITKRKNHMKNKNMRQSELLSPIVEMKYDVKTTVYCKDWSYSQYPMDTQTCNVSIGSLSGESIFTSYVKPRNLSIEKSYMASNFIITVGFFDRYKRNGNNRVGMEITMQRLTTSFFLKYYIPCVAIVLVSEIGFIIPLTAIPGRVALLVTQFLTLVNLFIHQMVSNS